MPPTSVSIEYHYRERLTTCSGFAPGSVLAAVVAAATPSTAANPDFLTCASNVSRSGLRPSGIRARSNQIRARSTRGQYKQYERGSKRRILTFVSVRVKHLLEFFLKKRHMIDDQGMIAPSHQLSRMKTSQSFRIHIHPCTLTPLFVLLWRYRSTRRDSSSNLASTFFR